MKKILLIGGTATNRALLKTALEEEGHRVSAAVTRKYTNTWLAHRIKPFDLIIYDTEEAEQAEGFWRELREAAGATPILVLASALDPLDYARLGMNHRISRPYTIGEVARRAGALLAGGG
ncbi:MAG: response regulator [Chloroflexi bacterium]|nr:response regulator [Chloroflexota bacterium]